MGATSGAGTASHSREPNVALFLSSRSPVAQSLVFFIVVCQPLQLLITPLVRIMICLFDLLLRQSKSTSVS
jgi:hypothetical protein